MHKLTGPMNGAKKMINLRRIYVYLVSAITLQSIVWALIALLRNLTSRSLLPNTSTIAAQVAMIVVGLPIFLAHWLWAQRSARTNPSERASAVRRFYLDSMLLAFVIPIVNSTRLLAEIMLENLIQRRPDQLSFNSDLRFSAIALLVTLIMGIYHFRVRRQDNKKTTQVEAAVILDQLLIYLLVIGGLVLTAFGLVGIIRFIIDSLSTGAVSPFERNTLAANLALIVAGFPLWIISWRKAQQRFISGDVREQVSLVRKASLYVIVLVSSLTAVVTASILLANLLMQLQLVPSSSGGLGNALSVILVSGAIWAYHATVLQQDARLAETVGQAATVRRIYLYLVSGVGLTAVLVGAGGNLSVLIRALGGPGLGIDLREQLAWFTAALLAGLPVWLISWRRVQQLIHKAGTAGFEERNAFTRRLYLALFALAAVLTSLGGTVYVVAQVVELILGSRTASGLRVDVGQALAYTMIAVAVLIYHGLLLRTDQQTLVAYQIKQQRHLKVAIIDSGSGQLGRQLINETREQLPGIQIIPIPISGISQAVMVEEPESESNLVALASADLIVTPWQLIGGPTADVTSDRQILDALTKSTAHKLILPRPQAGVTWIGVEPWRENEIVGEVVETIRRFAAGEGASARRKLGPAAIVILVLAALFGFFILLPLVIQLVALLFENPW